MKKQKQNKTKQQTRRRSKDEKQEVNDSKNTFHQYTFLLMTNILYPFMHYYRGHAAFISYSKLP